MLQINASIISLKILHTCKLFSTKNVKFSSLERSDFRQLLSEAIAVLFEKFYCSHVTTIPIKTADEFFLWNTYKLWSENSLQGLIL